MHVCPNCGHRNRPGVIFCENCGASQIGDSPISTKSVSGKPSGGVSGDPVSANITNAASDIFGRGTILRVEITGADSILLKPKTETVLGRRDPSSGAMPDLDLTPFAGYRMGVSRRHVLIKQNESENKLELVDLGSSNGTFLNGERLLSNHPHTLHDGDEIRLGQLSMKVYFQVQPVEQDTVSTSDPTSIGPAHRPSSEQKSEGRSTVEMKRLEPPAAPDLSHPDASDNEPEAGKS